MGETDWPSGHVENMTRGQNNIDDIMGNNKEEDSVNAEGVLSIH